VRRWAQVSIIPVLFATGCQHSPCNAANYMKLL